MGKLNVSSQTLEAPVKGSTWKSLVLDIDEGSYKDFPLKNRTTIASIISTTIKLTYPSRKYKISTKDQPGALRVHYLKTDNHGKHNSTPKES